MSLKRISILVLFSLVFLITRVPRLENDIINPDGVNWHYRSQQFINGLKYGDLAKTYQHYHPGVTVMWVTAPVIELFRQIPGNDAYNMYNFQGFDFVAKFALVIAQLLLTLLIVFYLAKIMGFYQSIAVVTLFSFEPFFVGNSRLYHLDILLVLFMFLSLCLFYLAEKSNKNSYYVLTGIALGLSFLTKTVAIILVAYILAYVLLAGARKSTFKKSLSKGILVFAVFCVTVFALFPALWVRPVYFIGNLFSEGMRVGVRKGHEVIVLGDELTEGGFLYYPLVLLIKLSPFLLAGLLAYTMSSLKKIQHFKSNMRFSQLVTPNFSIIIAGFYLFYFLVMLIPSKKLDRYMLVEFPVFAYFTFHVLNNTYTYFKNKKAVIGLGLLGFSMFVVIPLFTLFPFYFTYTSPLLGSPTFANTLIGQKPFGVGIYDLKAYILHKYGYYPSLGFVDTKPIEAIYPNSAVVDIREVSAEKYDLVILGPNESLPERVYRSPYNFVKDSSIYINGLEYWRIYVKRPK